VKAPEATRFLDRVKQSAADPGMETFRRLAQSPVFPAFPRRRQGETPNSGHVSGKSGDPFVISGIAGFTAASDRG
jgi:hypothetical protein